MKFLLFPLLFVLIIFQPTSRIWQYKDEFTRRGYNARFENLQRLYRSSQYVQKDNPAIINDYILEAYAGGVFLRGLNPILIVHDQPPLGRYIVALSIYLFDNEATIPIFLILISAALVYFIAYITLKNIFTSLIPFAIFINEPLFLSKIDWVPLLEPIQLPFILLAILFFLLSISKKNSNVWLLLVTISVGFIISTRFFVVGAALAFSFCLFYILKRNTKVLLTFILFSFSSLAVLVASYAKTLQSGYSVLQILGIQKYILDYHKSVLVNPFSFWDLLLFNRWHTWWGSRQILSDPHWTIFWPLSLVSVVIFLFVVLRKKIKASDQERVLILWIVAYSGILSLGYTSTRYFLPLLPFLYIVATSFVYKHLYPIFRLEIQKRLKLVYNKS